MPAGASWEGRNTIEGWSTALIYAPVWQLMVSDVEEPAGPKQATGTRVCVCLLERKREKQCMCVQESFKHECSERNLP